MKHGCVVLADIHHPMLEATRGLLDTKFRTVVMVSSCESLLEATIKIRPDLIVADLSLPSSDGHKLLLKSDNRLEEFNMIVLGTYNERGIVENIMKTGANGYVLKGAAATDLLLAVDIVTGGDNYVSPLVSSG
jgi:DNA-binding NarL/FixJ family response regulator